jgi:hypothetical protein
MVIRRRNNSRSEVVRSLILPKPGTDSPQVPINALTVHVGTGTDLSGLPTYQDLGTWSSDNFRVADNPGVGPLVTPSAFYQDLRWEWFSSLGRIPTAGARSTWHTIRTVFS